MCTFLIFDFHKRVWALILQSLPCRRVPFTAFLFIITPTGCRRPPVLTSVLKLSWNTPLVCYCAAAHHASSFDLLCYSLCKCSFSFCYCDTLCFGFCMSVSAAAAGFSLSTLSFTLFLVSCTSFSFLAAAFFYCVNDFLVSFFELGHFNIGVLFFLHMFNIPNRLMFFVFPPNMGVLPGRVDQESSHDTSMVTTHVDHVVGSSVLHISQVSSLGQNVVNLFFFPFWRDEGTSVCAASS